jgi:uncharacterized membrane protein
MNTIHPIMETIHPTIEYAALGIEIVAIIIIVVAVIWGTFAFLRDVRSSSLMPGAYARYKERLGRGLLLGLEILVAADVIRTIALEPTFTSLGVLGLLVVVRTFLSWSITVEIEGRWPWKRDKEEEQGQEGDTP